MSNNAVNSGAEQYIGDELALFALAKNWKNYWKSHLQPLLGNKVLEVGAGTGSNLLLLKQSKHSWTAVEPDLSQAEQIRQLSVAQEGSINVVTGTLASIADGQQFDSILYIDVLEHIEHDKEELVKAVAHLTDNGRLIILSPAHQSLYSPFDKAVGHFRRYNHKQLANLSPSDTIIERLFYLDSVGYLASWLNSKILKSSMPTPSQIWVWDSLMVPFSRLLDKLTNFRFGKTVVMVLKKQ